MSMAGVVKFGSTVAQCSSFGMILENSADFPPWISFP